MGISFNIEDVEQVLLNMSRKLKNETIDDILEYGAEPVLDMLDYNVPEDTKELKGTIGVIKKEGAGVKRKIHLGSKSKDRKIVERAYYQEHGNSSMMGKKWIKKSYQDTSKVVKTRVSKKIQESIFK